MARSVPKWLRPRWLTRLGESALIGGQAVAAIARGQVGFTDLMAELMEAGPAGCDSDKCLLPLAKPDGK